MPKKPTKSVSQEIHAKDRALTRFNIHLSSEDYIDIIKDIQAGKTTCVEKQSNRISLHYVTLPDGQEVIAVYDKTRKTIVTFMPEEYIDNKDQIEDEYYSSHIERLFE